MTGSNTLDKTASQHFPIAIASHHRCVAGTTVMSQGASSASREAVSGVGSALSVWPNGMHLRVGVIGLLHLTEQSQ